MIVSIDGVIKVVNDIKITAHDGMVVEAHETDDGTNMTVKNDAATYKVERKKLIHVLPEGHIETTHA